MWRVLHGFDWAPLIDDTASGAVSSTSAPAFGPRPASESGLAFVLTILAGVATWAAVPVVTRMLGRWWGASAAAVRRTGRGRDLRPAPTR